MIARVVIAGTSSGSGKTTIACGLIGALRNLGLSVQGFKVGPDFIDPSYHALASARPGRNLDAFLSGPELIAPLFQHGTRAADIAVIEGVMGLFDGVSGAGELASTAHVAKLLEAPVLLVVDASAMARSVAATVHGYRSFDPELEIAGVIINRVGSLVHEQILREAIAPLGIPVLGALLRDDRVRMPERHLGLVPANERQGDAERLLGTLAAVVGEHVDLEAVIALARSASSGSTTAPWSPEPAAEPVRDARIAIAGGPAFSFHYQENLELLESAGAQLLEFNPLVDPCLPDGAGALVLAGGFPEVFGAELSANESLRKEVASFARSGRPVIAECGGLLYLCTDLDGQPMCDVIHARARMTKRLTLGYREATAMNDNLYVARGEHLRGHEFHYSTVDPANGASKAAWTLRARSGERTEGFATSSLHASYLHVHWAAHPGAALGVARAASPARAAHEERLTASVGPISDQTRGSDR